MKFILHCENLSFTVDNRFHWLPESMEKCFYVSWFSSTCVLLPCVLGANKTVSLVKSFLTILRLAVMASPTKLSSSRKLQSLYFIKKFSKLACSCPRFFLLIFCKHNTTIQIWHCNYFHWISNLKVFLQYQKPTCCAPWFESTKKLWKCTAW